MSLLTLQVKLLSLFLNLFVEKLSMTFSVLFEYLLKWFLVFVGIVICGMWIDWSETEGR